MGWRIRTSNMKKLILIIIGAIFFNFILLPNKINSAIKSPNEWHEKSIIINHNIEKTKLIITDYKEYKKILPYVDNMKIISQRGLESICYFEHYMMGKPFWVQLRFKVVRNDSNGFILKSIFHKGYELAPEFEADTELIRISESQTKVISRLRTTTNISIFIPKGILSEYMDLFLEKSLINLKNIIK